MAILIRPWRREDVPAVRRILWESWLATYRAFIPEADLRAYFTATYQPESLLRLYELSFVRGLIGEADGEAAGFARTQYQKNENRLYLASLYLLPAFQGRGIGDRLLKAAEAQALALGLDELWVGVMVKNEAAGRWYERRGFRFIREEPFRMGGTTVSHRIGYKPIPGAAREAGLSQRLHAVYPGEREDASLAELAASLYEAQKKNWPALGEGCTALAAARVREIRGERWQVKVQFNPQRIVSAGAKVDRKSIGQRPCFLCPANLPPEQRAILYRDAYLVLCNPAPIFPGHLTIAHLRHLPQSLPANLEIFLRLAADFGPGTTVFYNGPRSGASAPDHLHFQAAPAGLMPVEAEVSAAASRTKVKQKAGATLWRTEGLGRGALVIEGKEAGAVAAAVATVLEALGRSDELEEEPLLNLLATHGGGGWRLILFPRRKHRPAAYFKEGEERLLVSPGAADMGGLFITPVEKDFFAFNRALVLEIFAEVAYDDAAVAALLESL
ncbi:MAG: GNAT family N-acetyltransferase [Deltaproteobacteria bacterium]|nr:GNAT family N-acetyltransferase [Deltaproteobacteria bacterium]